jgi:hypothetical protein
MARQKAAFGRLFAACRSVSGMIFSYAGPASETESFGCLSNPLLSLP